MKPAMAPRDWRRIHHSPIFWIDVVLCLAGIAIYVLSDDLTWRPIPSERRTVRAPNRSLLLAEQACHEMNRVRPAIAPIGWCRSRPSYVRADVICEQTWKSFQPCYGRRYL
jgi:hypothetical protein